MIKGWIRCKCGSRIDFESEESRIINFNCPECGRELLITLEVTEHCVAS